jgi:hypothetical protein
MKLDKRQGQFMSLYDSYKIDLKGRAVEHGIIRTGVASAIVYASVAAGWLYIAALASLSALASSIWLSDQHHAQPYPFVPLLRSSLIAL